MGNKILIIDDEPDLLRITTYRLRKAGYEILTAVNGKEALDLLEKELPGLIFLDLRLPLISGRDVCKHIKADKRLKNIPVVLFTASSDHISETASEIGADDYIIKPFEPEALLGKIKKFLG
ncbi:MAG: response regulator [Candidatus Omnitrophica bacterium]|nr:response regulator [Candidatus Omnitrophota bacterium]